MLGIFSQSFRNKIAYGAPSGGGGGGSASGRGVKDPVHLGTISLGGTVHVSDRNDRGGDGPHDPNITTVYTGTGTAGTSANSVEVIDAGTESLSGSITLETVSDYIADNSSALEQQYAAQESLIQAIPRWADMSAATLRGTVETIRHAGHGLQPGGPVGPGAPASPWDYAIIFGHELWPGILEEIRTAQQITDEHLHARELVEQGYDIAEAQMIANGHQLDEFVFSDEVGSFVEADVINENDILAASEVDVTEGLMIIDPVKDGLPSFALPARLGMDGFSSDDAFFHDYDVRVTAPSRISGQAGLSAVEWALQHNPTPGNDYPASKDGTMNDAGDIPEILWDGGDNFVFSHVIDNPNPDQTDIIVNYTVEGDHALEEGFVMRYGQIHDDGSIEIVTYGEGNAWEQGAPIIDNIGESKAESAWADNANEIFDTVLDILH